MGAQDQFAKLTLQIEVRRLGIPSVECLGPVELPTTELHLDSIVVVSVKGSLFELSAPWSLIQSNHVVVEYKMQRDHLDLQQVIHAETRRSAYHGYLLKREDSVPIGPPALWIVSGYLPEYLRTCRTVSPVSAGVHDLGQVYYQCFWIAANDLPLREELIPFLVARTGKYLEEFVRWVANKRDFQWMIHLLESIPMSSELYEEMFRKLPIPDDPEAPMRRKFIVEELLRRDPQLKEQLLEAGKKIGLEDGKKLGLEDGKKIGLEDGKKLGLEDGLRDGRVEEARKALLRVVSKRGFTLSESLAAMVAQCTDLATLEKWHDRAVLASSVAEIFANGVE